MQTAPDWTRGEFAILLTSRLMSDEEAAAEIESRSPGAVKIIRDALHELHATGQANDRLSRMMLEYVSRRAGQLHCPRCNERLEGDGPKA